MKTRQTSELLDELRGERSTRPAVDPTLAGGLRAWLEDDLAVAIDGLPSGRMVDLPAWRIAQPHELADPEIDHRGRSALVHALLVQHLAFGEVMDPLVEAMSALEAAGTHGLLLDRIRSLDLDGTRQLADELIANDAILGSHLGRVPSSWLPRSSVPIVADLCGSRVRASSHVDLLLGPPAGAVSSLCLVDIVTVPLGEHAPDHLAATALIETLRSGAAPLRVATLSTATGEHLVLEVDDELLVGALHRLVDATVQQVQVLVAQDAERSLSRIGR